MTFSFGLYSQQSTIQKAALLKALLATVYIIASENFWSNAMIPTHMTLINAVANFMIILMSVTYVSLNHKPNWACVLAYALLYVNLVFWFIQSMGFFNHTIYAITNIIYFGTIALLLQKLIQKLSNTLLGYFSPALPKTKTEIAKEAP